MRLSGGASPEPESACEPTSSLPGVSPLQLTSWDPGPIDAESALDELDTLTDANRRERAPEHDLRLVRLRYGAFREIEHSPGLTSWPRAVPDPFPGTDGLVETRADEIDAELVAGAILHHGCILVRSLLVTETVRHLVAVIDRAFDEQERWRQRVEAKDEAAGRQSIWFDPFTSGDAGLDHRLRLARMVREYNRVLLADSPAAMFDVCEAFERAGVHSLVSQYFGERPAMTISKSAMRRVGHLEHVLGYHQDAAVFGPGARSISIWLSLSDCGEDAPGLEVLPKRIDHVVERSGAGYALSPSCVEALGRGETVVPVFAPGDALVFDDRLVHRTAMTERMTKVRYSLENWFFAPNGVPLHQGAMVF